MRPDHNRECTRGNCCPRFMLPFTGLTSFTKINLNAVKPVEFQTKGSSKNATRSQQGVYSWQLSSEIHVAFHGFNCQFTKINLNAVKPVEFQTKSSSKNATRSQQGVYSWQLSSKIHVAFHGFNCVYEN